MERAVPVTRFPQIDAICPAFLGRREQMRMGFGLIVDNAIVVLESVFRRWQAGRAAADAATEGIRQVVLPILTSTTTTLIVFVPFYTRLYSTIIAFTLRRAWVAVTVAVLASGGSWCLFDNHVTPRRALGRGDGTAHIRLHQHRAPPGSDLERTDNLVRSFEGPLVRSIDTNSAGRFVRERATEFGVEVQRDQFACHDISMQELVARMIAAVAGQTSLAQRKIGGDEVRYEVKLEGYRS